MNLSEQSWFNSKDSNHQKMKIDKNWEKVTFGSNIKLANLYSSSYLSAPGVFYNTGSKQNAVTSAKNPSTGDMWVVHSTRDRIVDRGAAVGCGDKIRLKSTTDDIYLRSSIQNPSPLSNNQEVCAFDGQDLGDEWIVECKDSGSKQWLREEAIKLKHAETKKYLQALSNKAYNRPIDGHMEVSCSANPSKKADSWAALDGYYFNIQTK
ncbi:hypothetical protein BB559_002048 [Furculomyces boomerangus]|uniref:MIR domain-containing protein n=1 Tax=Furculomyces boomerangus TaxID=61424 RepID=A0A2T9YYK1_9FUNG|nr:hypothetical protein BB559_002048 [Furculomyces boomerangus]